MLKRLFIIFCVVAVIITMLLLIGCRAEEDDLTYNVKKSSMTGDFRITEGWVVIECGICVKNNTDKSLFFKMSGDFKKDCENKLLTDRYLTAINNEEESLFPPRFFSKNENNEIFTILPNETKTYAVVFMGSNNGGEEKNDRLPPPTIQFEVIG